MARNEEKHYGRLNRLILQKEKEEYEKLHPQRPRLDALLTVEEIQKWLPSIKKDLDFYLKKSMVTCYSEKHIEECRSKVNHLEGEYKAFVRKLTQLSSGTLDAIPWTNRAYKRKNEDLIDDIKVNKNFMPIPSPILEQETASPKTTTLAENMPLMNMPLSFNLNKKQNNDFQSAKKYFNEDNSSKSKRKMNSLPISNFVMEQHKLSCIPNANTDFLTDKDRSLSFNLNEEQNSNLKLPEKCSTVDKEVICTGAFSFKPGMIKIDKQNTSYDASKANIVSYDYSSDSDCS